jgi:hypothetical protein
LLIGSTKRPQHQQLGYIINHVEVSKSLTLYLRNSFSGNQCLNV